MSKHSPNPLPERAGIREALKALALERRKPDDADRPRVVSTFPPHTQPKPIPGQLELADD